MNRQALESLDKEALIDPVLTLAARVKASVGTPKGTIKGATHDGAGYNV